MSYVPGDDTSGLAAELAERLRIAHRRVRGLPADDHRKSVIMRRLLAISDAAKHDLRRASRRLDLLLEELDAAGC